MRHGVFVEEIATQMRKPRQVTSGIPFIVGTAPVHLLDNPAGAVNVPIRINTMNEAKAKLGYSEDFDEFTLCQSMYMNFSVFSVAPAIFVNVLDPERHNKNITGTVTVVEGQGTLREKNVLLAGLIVKNGEDDLTAGTDFVAAHDDDGYLLLTILADGITSVTVEGKALDASKVTASDVIGGVDLATGVETGLQLIREVYPQFGINAATILAPGFSHNTAVAAVMASLCEEINGVFRAETVIDIDTSVYKKYTDAEDMKRAIRVRNPHAYLVWPKVKIDGHILFASANVAAIAQYTDYQNGMLPNISPSNKMADIDAAVLQDGTEIVLDPEQGTVLNAAGIGTYVRVGGNFRLWGNYSAAYPDSYDPKDKFWCIRRFFSWHANNFITTYFDNVDDPTNKKLIDSIVDSENIVMNGYVAAGACAGATIAVSEKNTADTLMEGKLYFEQKITPFPPAQEIVDTLSFDPDALTEALSL